MNPLHRLKTFLRTVPSRITGSRVWFGAEHVTRIRSGVVKWPVDAELEHRRKVARKVLQATGRNIDKERK